MYRENYIKSPSDFQVLLLPSPEKDVEELSSRMLYKLHKATDKLMKGRFAPVDSFKLSTNGILSFLARQEIRWPILIKDGSNEAASEILQLVLELGSFVLLDPVFATQESALIARPILKYLWNLQMFAT